VPLAVSLADVDVSMLVVVAAANAVDVVDAVDAARKSGGGEKEAMADVQFSWTPRNSGSWYKIRVPTRGYFSQSVVFQSVHIAVILNLNSPVVP